VRERGLFHPFRRLREGKLFQVETEYSAGNCPAAEPLRKSRSSRRVEHYWLCDACSPFVTLTFDQQRGVITVPLPGGAGQKIVKVILIEEAPKLNASMDRSFLQSVREVKK